ncbi:hypothetical protein J6590_022837 [Homalodisca vitripennis]|nr:hypothetical protein J6590_022837 [Homalodisca vitripennis]
MTDSYSVTVLSTEHSAVMSIQLALTAATKHGPLSPSRRLILGDGSVNRTQRCYVNYNSPQLQPQNTDRCHHRAGKHSLCAAITHLPSVVYMTESYSVTVLSTEHSAVMSITTRLNCSHKTRTAVTIAQVNTAYVLPSHIYHLS